MNNEPHKWSPEDSVRSIRDIVNIGKTALSDFISWASEIPGKIDEKYANQINGDNDD